MTSGSSFLVDLPAGGQLTLNDSDEVAMWNTAAERYIEDYGLTKANDLTLLGAVLSCGIEMFRAQRDLSDAKKATSAAGRITKMVDTIREIEKQLGIDKKTREAGGKHTVEDYLTRLKHAANMKGVQIAERVKAYEQVMMEARWKIRLLRNGDAEDRQYHGISEKAIVDWLEGELGRIEDADKDWAKTKGRVFVGKL